VVDLGIVVDDRAAEPPSEQVRAQIAGLITTGQLLPGDRLPTVRSLAADLGLAANTVARAFKQLETAGLVETHSRAGTTVASGRHTSQVALGVLASRYAAVARDAGLDVAAAVALVRKAFAAQDS
jgi:DNA-binding transcriptional regulator YhcF (GntR family)